MKNGTEVTFKISLSVIGDSNDENNFPHKLSLTNTKVSKLRKAFARNSSANITQLHKIRKSGGFLCRPLKPLLKTGLPLIRYIPKPLAKSVLIPLGLTAAASATDAAIHTKKFGYGTTTLLLSKEERNDIMKIIKSLKESELLIKSVNETIKNETKEQKGKFLGMLLGTLGPSL